MRLAMLGLGKMGANMTARLLRGGHQVVAFNRSEGPRLAAEAIGAEGALTLDDVTTKLTPPRVAWLMFPAGEVTEHFLDGLLERLAPGDVIVDGGNSHYTDSVRRAARVGARGLHFVDVGTSGGIWGLTEGYSLMVGGVAEAVARLRPALETLAPAPDRGWGHVGPSGAGHFVKMVHNGIEYGLMEAYAEGFEVLHGKTEFQLDLHQVAELWRSGSVVRSWLLDLTARALADNPTLAGIAPYIPDSGEGRWTVIEAVQQGTSVPAISIALANRFRSQDTSPFGDKLQAALRNQFGGHAVKPEHR